MKGKSKYMTLKRKSRINTLTGILFLLALLLAIGGGELTKYVESHRKPMLIPYSNSGSGNVNDLAIVRVDNGETTSQRELSGDSADAKPTTTEKELITFYSEKYNVNEKLVTCIIAKESTFNPEAIGDHGKAVGYAQFWAETWKRMRKQMGLETTDLRTDKAEAIKTLCFGLSTGRGHEWSTYKKCI